mmetsp:Transcript_31568/g.74524  ORF Transcript_31568/g.74524 Transcript_31568/m.74524 type:complete len:325 (-) Transcript_31568:83-1057(-)
MGRPPLVQRQGRVDRVVGLRHSLALIYTAVSRHRYGRVDGDDDVRRYADGQQRTLGVPARQVANRNRHDGDTRTHGHFEGASLEGLQDAVRRARALREGDDGVARLQRADRLLERLELASPRGLVERDVLSELHGPPDEGDLEDARLGDVLKWPRHEAGQRQYVEERGVVGRVDARALGKVLHADDARSVAAHRHGGEGPEADDVVDAFPRPRARRVVGRLRVEPRAQDRQLHGDRCEEDREAHPQPDRRDGLVADRELELGHGAILNRHRRRAGLRGARLCAARLCARACWLLRRRSWRVATELCGISELAHAHRPTHRRLAL